MVPWPKFPRSPRRWE